MTEYGVDFLKMGIYKEVTDLISGFVTELRRLVRKAESGIEISRGCRSLLDLERAYFRDVLELLCNHAVDDFGKLIARVKPATLRSQLKDELVLNLKRAAAMTVIESDLCRTVLMDEFSELMTRFSADLERTVRRPPIAA